MTRREAERLTHQTDTLVDLGFTRDEADALRRISMTLHRWYELECGDSNAYGSWAIERDENGDGPPFMVRHIYTRGHGADRVIRTRIPDRERGALARLAKIINARNERHAAALVDWAATHADATPRGLSYHLQTDPRGAALYILRPGDVPEGGDPSSYYTRGICVY